jgi:hypothetical protein
MALLVAPGSAQVSGNLLPNPSFEEPLEPNGLPAGWALYAGSGQNQAIRLVKPGFEGEWAMMIDDPDPAAEIGVSRQVPAEGNLVYEVSAQVKAVEGASGIGTFMQLRFLPSQKLVQTSLAASSSTEFERVAVRGQAPPDTTTAVIYLYTHREPTPKVIVDAVALVSGVEPPPPPPPEPVPPVYTQVKDLHLETELVRDGKANVTIVAPASGLYAAEAKVIQSAIRAITGAEPPIAADDSPAAAVPIQGNLVVLGNRSTNRTCGKLYDLYYTLTDLRYPGPNGYEVRTLHSPFGDGRNVLLVGGSDATGVAAGAEALVAKLQAAGGEKGRLAVGRLMEVRLGDGIQVPTDIKQFEVWEASAGYGSTGYFGWNSISKRMAMYYMTGDETSAREVIRLAFPDAQAKQDIADIDGERIENKDDPLAGPYHYNAHLMILFWDLIEESPLFTDAERLQVTNAFSRQLNHRKGEGIYGRTEPPPCVGSRHGQWAAVSLYCLGRYFQKDYPGPIWQHCLDSSVLEFRPLHSHAWIAGENDNLFWYDTGIAPILTYMVLTGDRKPAENGVLAELLRGQEILVTGERGHWDLRSAALDFLHKTAYITQDGRWLTYRDRTGVDLSLFRLGQSFWPEEGLLPAPPTDLVGRWSIHPMPRPMWQGRGTGFELAESFLFGSYRSAVDATGDFTLIDGFNGASRNPYHTYAILDLRLGGVPILAGYRNQVLTRADGLVEPAVAMDGALQARDVVGGTAFAVAEVPNAAYCSWRRALIQRTGQYAVVIDDLGFRTDADNMEIQTLWETPGGQWDAPRQALSLSAVNRSQLPAGWTRFRALEAVYTSDPTGEGAIARLDSLDTLLLRATQPGQWLEVTFTLPEAKSGEVFANLLGYVDRGRVRVVLDGETLVPDFDNYAANAEPQFVPLGKRELAAGEHRLRLEVIARREGSEKCYVGLSGLLVQGAGAEFPRGISAYNLVTGERTDYSRNGAVSTMLWTGPVKAGEHRLGFSAIAPQVAGHPLPMCWRMTDTSAALSLPASAVAFAGDYEGCRAEFGIIAQDHLFGRGLTEEALETPLVRADHPIDIDWDFATGEAAIAVPHDTRVWLALGGPPVLDGKPAGGTAEAGGLALDLQAGRHRLTKAKPRDGERTALMARLDGIVAAARNVRETALAEPPTVVKVEAPPLLETMQAAVGGEVVAMAVVPSPDGPLMAVAEGQTVHLLRADGSEVRTLAADGKIRLLRWWPEHELLLAGCADEKVIAFALDGQRKWVYVSEMHPDVFTAAKTYWFKSAPGHEGIHGLSTGVFLDGKSQCFVGSACTLEILDENGQRVQFLPVFWGPVSDFALIDGPDGSINLVCSQRYNGTNMAAVINNRTLDPNPRNFWSVPAGATYVGGWSAQNRMHIFYADVDGDGTKEVISETNGTWNRVTVWDAQGNARWDASFGPGDAIPVRNMRDLDLADLNGDGKTDILAATSAGLVVCLSYDCQKRWATRLPSPPTVLKVVRTADGTPWIIVGCESGAVVALDAGGKPTRLGTVDGSPTVIDASGQTAVLATNKGEVKGFRVGE